MKRIIAGVLVISLATAVALYAQDPRQTQKRITGRSSDAPVLLAPSNGSIVTDFFPVFQWRQISAPAGVKLSYTLVIAERLPGQSLKDALELNDTFHDGVVEQGGSYKYPTTGNPFEKGKEYAFQVTSYLVTGDYQPAEGAKSEIWYFKFGADRPRPQLITPPNGSNVTEFSPTFRWKAFDVPPGVKVTYTLTIAERHPGQSLQDAIANNYSFHEGDVDVIGVYKYPTNDGDGGKIRDEGPGLKSQSRKHERRKRIYYPVNPVNPV